MNILEDNGIMVDVSLVMELQIIYGLSLGIWIRFWIM